MKGGMPGALMAALEEALGSGLVEDAVLAGVEADRIAMWAAREQMSDVQSKEGASIKHDVSVPIAEVPRADRRGHRRGGAG